MALFVPFAVKPRATGSNAPSEVLMRGEDEEVYLLLSHQSEGTCLLSSERKTRVSKFFSFFFFYDRVCTHPLSELLNMPDSPRSKSRR